MGILEQASAWLEHQRLMNLAVPIVYMRKDGAEKTISATVGKTLFRSENEYGATIRTESRDFLIAGSDLPDEPVRGDRIVYDGHRYEVLAPNGEPVWRWCGSYHWTRRIHTKEIGGA